MALDRFAFSAAIALYCAAAAGSTSAEDVVIARSASDSAVRVKRSGEILDYTGTQLTLRTSLGRDELIPAGRVVEIQTAWSPAHEQARAARKAGKLSDAIAAFRQAKEQDSRPWAQRQIAAELAGTWLEAGDIGAAGDEFLSIAAVDPDTMHFDVAPIAWQATTLAAASEARAAAWLADDKAPAARLLGASWLVGSSRRGEVEAVLQSLADSKSRHIAGLAKIQRWRSRLATASTGDLEQWSRELSGLPAEIQAAGWYVLGDGYARHDELERAAIAYLKPPLVFRQQRALAADGLLAAARQLAQLGQTDEAASLNREILRDFSHLPAAEEARAALSKAPQP